MKNKSQKSLKYYAIIFVLILFSSVNLFAQNNVLISYHSQSGKTKKMAETIAIGAKSIEGTNVLVKSIDETTPEDLEWAKAIIVGSPVHNVNVSPHMLTKLMSWSNKHTQNKIGAVFATSGSMSSGEEIVQMNLILNLLMKGMIVVGGPDYSQPFGASAVTREEPFGTKTPDEIAPQFLKKGEALGKRVAETVKKLK